jgi:hypothetical protein
MARLTAFSNSTRHLSSRDWDRRVNRDRSSPLGMECERSGGEGREAKLDSDGRTRVMKQRPVWSVSIEGRDEMRGLRRVRFIDSASVCAPTAVKRHGSRTFTIALRRLRCGPLQMDTRACSHSALSDSTDGGGLNRRRLGGECACEETHMESSAVDPLTPEAHARSTGAVPPSLVEVRSCAAESVSRGTTTSSHAPHPIGASSPQSVGKATVTPAVGSIGGHS